MTVLSSDDIRLFIDEDLNDGRIIERHDLGADIQNTGLFPNYNH